MLLLGFQRPQEQRTDCCAVQLPVGVVAWLVKLPLETTTVHMVLPGSSSNISTSDPVFMHPRRQQMMAQGLRPLPSTRETWMAFLAQGFNLGWSMLLQEFGK